MGSGFIDWKLEPSICVCITSLCFRLDDDGDCESSELVLLIAILGIARIWLWVTETLFRLEDTVWLVFVYDFFNFRFIDSDFSSRPTEFLYKAQPLLFAVLESLSTSLEGFFLKGLSFLAGVDISVSLEAPFLKDLESLISEEVSFSLEIFFSTRIDFFSCVLASIGWLLTSEVFF
jgi:hypothetical protein